jgi:phosphatidylethanolamine/phosphatidyl-N-methylethanolamine N-methyltransferase
MFFFSPAWELICSNLEVAYSAYPIELAHRQRRGYRQQPDRTIGYGHPIKATSTATLNATRSDRMSKTMNHSAVVHAYKLLAPIYDFGFTRVFAAGRALAIAAADRIGGRILDVGVGTGIALPLYSPANQIVGIDLSADMLKKAQERARHLPNVEGVSVMDAQRLSFPDESFDVVVAQYFITTTPDPHVALNELARVLKPGGEIILVNHIAAEGGLRELGERLFAPIGRALGWHSDFPWERIDSWVRNAPGISVVERRPVSRFSLFTLMRFKKAARAVSVAA